jgi:hypothetical protein
VGLSRSARVCEFFRNFIPSSKKVKKHETRQILKGGRSKCEVALLCSVFAFSRN